MVSVPSSANGAQVRWVAPRWPHNLENGTTKQIVEKGSARFLSYSRKRRPFSKLWGHLGAAWQHLEAIMRSLGADVF